MAVISDCEENMQNHFGKLAGIVLVTLVIVGLPILSSGQDRDVDTSCHSPHRLKTDDDEQFL
jgi:hypothetical protein